MSGLLTIPLRPLAMLPGPVMDGGWLVENHESVILLHVRKYEVFLITLWVKNKSTI
jgi:hypothetical protein